MNGRVLLDTNIVIAFFAHEDIILENMKAVEKFFVPTVVLGELYFGRVSQKNECKISNESLN